MVKLDFDARDYPDFEDPEIMDGWKRRPEKGVRRVAGMDLGNFCIFMPPAFARLKGIALDRVDGFKAIGADSTHRMGKAEREKKILFHNLLGVLGEMAGHMGLYRTSKGFLLQHDRYKGQCDGGQDVLNTNINFKTSLYRPGGLRGYVSPEEFRRNMCYVFCWAKMFGAPYDQGWACAVGWAEGWEFPAEPETPIGWNSPVYILPMEKLHPIMPVIKPYKAIDDPFDK